MSLSDPIEEERSNPNRRKFLAIGGAVAGGSLLAACSGGSGGGTGDSDSDSDSDSGSESKKESGVTHDGPEVEWSMAAAWPTALDTLFGKEAGAQFVAERVSTLTNGKFVIDAKPAGELVDTAPAILQGVAKNTFEASHTVGTYNVGDEPATAFATAIPFGMSSRQQNAWWYFGGGREVMHEFYRDEFNVITFNVGNTGQQMGGWWKTEVNTLADLKGMKVRAPGLGGEVLSKLGVAAEGGLGGEALQKLSSGNLDAAEFLGPVEDKLLGFQDAADYYYAPGFWEPGAVIEMQVNLDAWNELPGFYQEVIRSASAEANLKLQAVYDAKNQIAFQELVKKGVKPRVFSDEILEGARKAAAEVMAEKSEESENFRKIWEESYKPFMEQTKEWFAFHDLLN